MTTAAERQAADEAAAEQATQSAEAPKEKAGKGGSQLYRFHFNAGSFRDGQETELTDDEAAAYFPRYCTKISGPGEAPSSK